MQKVAEFLELTSPQDRLPLVCKWAERSHESGKTVAIHTADETQAAELDQILWTFRQNAFVPHTILSRAEQPVIDPVLIVIADEDVPDSDVLIVASGREPGEWPGRFPHIYDFAEIYDEELRAAARKRFKTYSESGYRMRYIK